MLFGILIIIRTGIYCRHCLQKDAEERLQIEAERAERRPAPKPIEIQCGCYTSVDERCQNKGIPTSMDQTRYWCPQHSGIRVECFV